MLSFALTKTFPRDGQKIPGIYKENSINDFATHSRNQRPQNICCCNYRSFGVERHVFTLFDVLLHLYFRVIRRREGMLLTC